MKKLLAPVLMGAAWMLSGAAAGAQTIAPQESSSCASTISNQDLELLRKDPHAKRRQLIAANLRLTDAEAERFWPCRRLARSERSERSAQKKFPKRNPSKSAVEGVLFFAAEHQQRPLQLLVTPKRDLSPSGFPIPTPTLLIMDKGEVWSTTTTSDIDLVLN